MAGSYDENNSTVRWIPAFVRRWLGLTGEFERPGYSESRDDRRRYGEDTVGWIPDPFRRALGLEYAPPKAYPPSSAPYNPKAPISSAAPPPAPLRSYSPPVSREPVAAPRAEPAGRAGQGSGRMTFGGSESRWREISAGRSAMVSGGSESRMREIADASPTPASGGSEARMREIASKNPYSGSGGGERLEPGSKLPDLPQTEGYIQPISFLLRAYARGALPPQGLEQFSKEARATGQQVWDMYSYWIRFQTDEIGKLLSSLGGKLPIKPVAGLGEKHEDRLQHIKVETPVEAQAAAPAQAVAPTMPPPAPKAATPPPKAETPAPAPKAETPAPGQSAAAAKKDEAKE